MACISRWAPSPTRMRRSLLKAKLSGVTAAPVFISSVVRNQQILHRVRLGPIGSADEVSRTQDSIRVANLGQPTLVRPD